MTYFLIVSPLFTNNYRRYFFLDNVFISIYIGLKQLNLCGAELASVAKIHCK